ncbi:MAG: hypothetical protein Q7U18_04970 [Methylobacter sp.]|nr:hypothetical protein [Methylobacter sp.]
MKNTTILSKIKLIFFQHFEQAVDDCCMRIDVEFGLQLGKNREKMNKERYIKLLEYLRSVRRDIGYPLKPLKLNADGRIALYKTFEVVVFSQLGFIYRELIKQCEADVIPEIVVVEQYNDVPMPAPLYVVGEIRENAKPASEGAEQISAEFALLQEKLELWRWAHFPSAYDSISVTAHVFYEQVEIKYALQMLQQFNDDTDSGENKQPLKWQVLKKLKELSFSVDDKILAK